MLTFDYNEKYFTSFSSPLNDYKESVTKNVEKVKNFGCKGEKIVVGVSSYGKVYKLKKISKNEIGADALFLGDVEYYKVKNFKLNF